MRLVLVVATLATVASAQQTLLVPTQYPTIQAAIIAATNGDIISVAAGTYIENLDFLGKVISVTSVDGPDVTVVNGGGNGRGVLFASGESPAAVLRGFTVTGGAATYTGLGYSDYGGGIFVAFSSPTIEDCVIVGNVAANAGGGVACFIASPTIRRCRIANNTASSGGNVFVQDASSPVIESCLIDSGSANGGGGIGLYNAATAWIENCTIANNSAVEGGGVSCVWNSAATLRNTIVWGNTPPAIHTSFAAGDGVVTALGCDLEVVPPLAVACISADPSFVSGTFELSPDSPCIDVGLASSSLSGVLDLAGDARTIAGSTDIGCDEYFGLGTAAQGNVGGGSPGAVEVLLINGQFGGPRRRVDVAVDSPVTISLVQLPNNNSPAAFVLFGLVGVPSVLDAVDLGFGSMCFVPYALNPSYPGAFQVASSFQPDPVSLTPGSLTPWSYTKTTGLHYPITLTFQAVWVQYTPTFAIQVTNGVLLNVE